MTLEELKEIFGGSSKTDAEIAKAIREWDTELRQNVLRDLDALISRDHGTERVEMWREIRDGYVKEFSEAEAGDGNK